MVRGNFKTICVVKFSCCVKNIFCMSKNFIPSNNHSFNQTFDLEDSTQEITFCNNAFMVNSFMQSQLF